jgi:phosphoglycolate phosphatase
MNAGRVEEKKNGKTRYVILDYDGTICDSRPSIIYAMEQTMLRYGFATPDSSYVTELIGSGKVISETISLLVGEKELVNAGGLDNVVTNYRNFYVEEGYRFTTLFPGARETFRYLREHNISIIVVSNKGIRSVEQSLVEFELLDFVSDLVADGANGTTGMPMKPDPWLFNKILRPKYPDISYNNCMMVGDTTADIIFAHNCELTSCWAEYGYGDKKACLGLNPDHVIDSITRVQDIVTL